MGHALEDKPSSMSLYRHLARLKDPTLLAVLCEDAAACAGVPAGGAERNPSRATSFERTVPPF